MADGNSGGGLFSCITDSVSMLLNIPSAVFEGDSQAAAAGVYRRAHIASFHSNAALPPDSDTTVAPLMMPRMINPVNPAVPEVSIRVVDGQTRVVQVASRVPNRLAGTELEVAPNAAYGFAGGPSAVKPPTSSNSYPSLLLAEKEEEERAREVEARKRELEARQRQAEIRDAVSSGRQQGQSRAQPREEIIAASAQGTGSSVYGDAARKRTTAATLPQTTR